MLCPIIAAVIVFVTIVVSYYAMSYYYQQQKEATSTPTPIEVIYRLPLNIKPIHYKIILDLNVIHRRQQYSFNGECFIEIQVLKNTSQIQLHIMDLNILSVQYYIKNTRNKYNLPTATPNNLTNIVVYNLKQELQANEVYILHYRYAAGIGEDMRGLYRSKYATSEWFFATHIQPIYARSVFPCFDEPKFKAIFELWLAYQKPFISQGPTPHPDKHNTIGHRHVLYKATPIMSTYLLNFIISKFSVRKNNEISVAAIPEYFSQTEYSFDFGNNISTAFHKYFDTNFSTTSQNHISLNAFPNSALSESLILYDKNQSTLNSKQLSANSVAYEVSHLWWGHLVTCDWWGYTWLTEAFTSYFQYFGTDLVDSSFKMPSQFVLDVIQTVMNVEATTNVFPMTNENVRTKAEISLMFNSVSNHKGATFIRMTKHILEEENFRKSLTEYLTTHAYKNTRPSDLLKIWKIYWPIAYHDYLESYFNSFTTQVGYPVVTFKLTSNTTVEVSQKRFLLKDFHTANPKLTYTVPITFTTSSENDFENVHPKFFLQQEHVIISVSRNDSWIIGNIQETGYYRVNYDTESWNRIREKLCSESRTDIHELNRAQIVDDLFNLARADEIQYSLAFKVLQYLQFERSYLSWTAALNGFSYIMTRLGYETDIFSPYIRDMINGTFNELGFQEKNGDTTFDIYNRGKILGWACKLGIAECITKAKSYFNQNIKTNSVPVNIRTAVYCTVMREGNETDFNTLYNKYTNENVASEKVLILDSLCCIKDSKLVNRFFQIILSDVVKPADKSNVLIDLCTKNKENVNLVFDLIDQNIEQLANATGGYSSVAETVFEIAEYFATEAQLQKLNSFISKYTEKFGNTLESAVKRVELNLKWSKKLLGNIKRIMDNYMKENHA